MPAKKIPTKNGIIVLVVAAIIALAIIALSYFYLTQIKPPAAVTLPKKAPEIVPPEATGNVDDAVNAFLKELTDEQLLLGEEEGDTSLITTDSQEIGDFGQSINEQEL